MLVMTYIYLLIHPFQIGKPAEFWPILFNNMNRINISQRQSKHQIQESWGKVLEELSRHKHLGTGPFFRQSAEFLKYVFLFYFLVEKSIVGLFHETVFSCIMTTDLYIKITFLYFVLLSSH